MIDLTQAQAASPQLHSPPCDPQGSWSSRGIAIDAPPDDDVDPAPDAQWSPESARTGLCGVVAPRIVALPEGVFRMYYTQILPRPGFPQGANDYDTATARILSAVSTDGLAWTPEPGVRLSPEEGGAGEFRVVSGDVVPCFEDGRRLRMYYECCDGPQSKPNSIRSAVSDDGLHWSVEPGARFELAGRNISSPRIIFLDQRTCRFYCGVHGEGMISAISSDGLTFEQEPGWRVVPDNAYDRRAAFASEIMRLSNGAYRMYYAGYGSLERADILSAESDDGLHWVKADRPVLSPSRTWDAAKCSEMCTTWDPAARPGDGAFRMHYEACDGTAPGNRGVWRIVTAECSR